MFFKISEKVIDIILISAYITVPSSNACMKSALPPVTAADNEKGTVLPSPFCAQKAAYRAGMPPFAFKEITKMKKNAYDNGL